ncbi:hypothetical protein AHAS_Ahas09G0177300 [Arachis hypogaea]
MNTSKRIYQCCLQCKTRYKRHKGSPRVDGDEDVDDVDDLANEFNYGQGKSLNNAISQSRINCGDIWSWNCWPFCCTRCKTKGSILNNWPKAFGFTEVVDPSSYQELIAQVIKHIIDGRADFSFECVGDTDMITTALQSCCYGWGLIVTLGVPKVKPEMSAHYGLFLMGRTLKGSLFGRWKPKSDIPLLVEKYVNKDIQIDDYITHNLPFDDINNAFDLMKEEKCLHCVIHMPR